MTEEKPQAADSSAPQFAIVRLYLKDVSFETPNSPDIFNENFQPEIKLQFGTSVNPLPNNLYEVVLNVTVTSKEGDKTGFLVEVQQAGIFHLSGLEDAQRDHTLGAYCPNILFPYLREAVSDLVSKGSFPQLILTPVDFESIYMQKMNKMNPSAEQEKANT